MAIHGDDFTILGFEENLNWFKNKIEGKYEIKHRGRLGPGDNDEKAITILNRVVWWDNKGIKYEPDQRHAEIIIKHTGVENKQSVVTPGIKPSDEKDEEGDDDKLDANSASKYRAITAR